MIKSLPSKIHSRIYDRGAQPLLYLPTQAADLLINGLFGIGVSQPGATMCLGKGFRTAWPGAAARPPPSTARKRMDEGAAADG